MRPSKIPASTYRLQFNRHFTYADAIEIVPYLNELGISHVYASPLLRVRSGSEHGYDVVDHNSLNPEIGDADAFNGFVAALHRHGMGLILDTVPNHMHVGDDQNDWWQDLLEHGRASPYAGYFDIDWHPAKRGLRDKVLLPVLGDHYGNVLDRGELRLEMEVANGSLHVRYFDRRFPLDPLSYERIISLRLPLLRQRVGSESETATALSVLAEAFGGLPPHTATDTATRRDAAAACKRQLAALFRRDRSARSFLQETLECINSRCSEGDIGLLHELLEQQAYRLAYWRVAADEINYRRFFDINELACIRMEIPEVFEATHRLIRQLVGGGAVDGLRIDHVDGLNHPRGYCERLQRLLGEALSRPADTHRPTSYLLVEKVLASHERMPTDWPVAGTTGYEVAQLLNGLFVAPASETMLTRLYQRFSGRRQSFDEILYDRKKMVIFHALSSELTALANLLNDIAQADPHTRDFTYHGLREALAEVVARFPVYRTYVGEGQVNDEDRRYVHWAIAQAKKSSLGEDVQVYDFIARMLLPEDAGDTDLASQVARFVARFQQYTAPVTAKALEDTACYVYNRLVSLNEVGSSPSQWGVTAHAFHSAMRQRLENWPDAMVSTSTHDSKRSEDVRVRIDVLSEIPIDWRRHLTRWSRINRNRKRLAGDRPAPSRNDEYFIYQTLLGAWPQHEEEDATFADRLQAYMLKAVKEAKIHTSWLNPDQEYEEAVQHFIAALLSDPARNAFLADFIPFQQTVAYYGMLNGLSQILLKLGLPGVPDTYQGSEIWSLSLVDPDNRRPVDYAVRRKMLQELLANRRDQPSPIGLLRGMLENLADGRAKLYLTWRALTLRREMAEHFRQADYAGLGSNGERADNLIAFARSFERRSLVYAAARRYCDLSSGPLQPPCGDVWSGTWLQLPGDRENRRFRELFSGVTIHSRRTDAQHAIAASDLFAHWPVAVLIEEAP